jgi:signal transduction histidine kinase
MQIAFLTRLRRNMFALPLAALAALVVVAINETGYNQSIESLSVLGERGAARVRLLMLLRELVDAEAGQRGYLLTGRLEYLKPYQDAVRSVDESLRELDMLYSEEPLARSEMQLIAQSAREKLSELAATLELYSRGDDGRWKELLMTNIGKEKMDELRKRTGALIESSNVRIEQQREGVFQTLNLSRIGVNAMAALALLALFMFLRKTQALAEVQREHGKALLAERDHLEAEVARRTADLRELATHLQTVREDERSRLARELHDELGALLTAAKFDGARLKRSLGQMAPEVEERLKHLNSTLDQGISLKRRIIEDLSPSALSNLGLVAALEILAKEFAQMSEIKVRTALEPVVLSPRAQITVYRLVQESLTNVAKYAKAGEVTIGLARDAERAHVSVRDNGVGFDPARIQRSAHGLVGMRYRVEAEGGTMAIHSAPGQGTRIEAWLPQPGPAAAADTAPASSAAS